MIGYDVIFFSPTPHFRIQSFMTGVDFYDSQDIEPARYSSFKASDSQIVNIWPLNNAILQVSQTNCKLYTKGGLVSGLITDSVALRDLTLPDDANFQFTCSTVFKRAKNTRTSYELETQRSWQWPTHLMLGK
jgi:hypothetical protein